MKLFSLTLFLCLFLTACGGVEDKIEEAIEPTCEQDNSCTDDGAKDDDTDDDNSDDENSEDDSADDDAEDTGTASIASLSGTVAVGVAVSNAEVSVFDKSNQKLDIDTLTTSNGSYSLTFAQAVSAPFKILVKAADGSELLAIVDDPNATSVNINPITTFVAKTVLKDTSLSEISEGQVANAGQDVVNTLFGEGARYQAFATDEFVAKNATTDLVSQVSAADVVLDTLSQTAGDENLYTFIEQAMATESHTLMASPEFIKTLATNLALVEGNQVSINELFDDEETSDANKDSIEDIEAIQEVAETAIFEVGKNETLTPEQQIAAVNGLVDIVIDSAPESVNTNSSDIFAIADNVITNLADEVLDAVTNEENDTLSLEQLLASMAQLSTTIVESIEASGIDMTQQDADLSSIESSLNTTDWDNANWDNLNWQ